MQISKKADVPDLDVQRIHGKVIEQHQISPDGYHLIIARAGVEVEAGRLITIHGRSLVEDRSYTVVSGERDEHIEVLYRLIPTGALTPQLAALQAGADIEWSGPFGQFVLRDPTRPIWFIATGTGIAPCRAYIRTHPALDATIFHGVRHAAELYFRDEFSSFAYHPCLSADNQSDCFSGRVTHLLKDTPCPPDAHYYLCGAYEMIYEVQDLLLDKGISPDHIFNEGYYYRLDP